MLQYKDMNRKPFDKELYDKDDNAKYQVISFLENLDFEAFVNPNTYGIDVIARSKRTGNEWGFEVEVKHVWHGPDYVGDTVHIPERKRKFAKQNSYFAMTNDERTHFLIIPGRIAMVSPIITKDTRYTKNEGFMNIPMDEVYTYILPPMPDLENKID